MSDNPKMLQAIAEGKAPLDYLDPAADEEIAWTLKGGAEKYGRQNFRDADTEMKLTTYIGAIKRHVAAMQKGQMYDPDDGRHHMAHIGACVHVVIGALDAGTIKLDTTDTEVKQLSDRVHVDGDMQAKSAAVIDIEDMPENAHNGAGLGAHAEALLNGDIALRNAYEAQWNTRKRTEGGHIPSWIKTQRIA